MGRIEKSYNSDRGFGNSSEVSGFLVRRSGLIAAIVIIIIAGGAFYTQSFARVPAGYRGVLLTWGKPEDKIQGEAIRVLTIRDPRLPMPGTVLTRKYKGKTL